MLPDLYSFNCVREYLKTYAQHCKKESPSWSVSKWAKKVGASDPSTLTKVLNGSRTIGPELAIKLAKDLALVGPEKQYFFSLIKLSDTNSKSKLLLKHEFSSDRLPSTGIIEKLKGHEKSMSIFYDWYVVAIRELFLNPNIKLSKSDIAKTLRPQVSLAEVERSLQILEDIGEITKISRVKWQSRNVQIETAQDVSISTARRYQRRVLELEKSALENIGVDSREFQTLTFAFRIKDLPKIKAKIRNFKQEILDEFEVKSDFFATPYAVGQFHLSLFPISNPISSMEAKYSNQGDPRCLS